MPTDYLSLEWQTLQNQFDSYEKYSLLIKLVAVLVTTIAIVMELNVVITVLIIGTLWLQDGIWKTFQSRFEHRILAVEEALATNHAMTGCQFNQDYQANAHSGKALIIEYVKQALRPTVMFPFVVLEIIAIGAALLL